jgi:hypothetical protein
VPNTNKAGKLVAVLDAQLGVDAIEVAVDCPHRHAESIGDLTASQASTHQAGDFTLAVGER